MFLFVVLILKRRSVVKCWPGKREIKRDGKRVEEMQTFIMVKALEDKVNVPSTHQKIQEERLLIILQPSADSPWHIFSMRYINK